MLYMLTKTWSLEGMGRKSAKRVSSPQMAMDPLRSPFFCLAWCNREIGMKLGMGLVLKADNSYRGATEEIQFTCVIKIGERLKTLPLLLSASLPPLPPIPDNDC